MTAPRLPDPESPRVPPPRRRGGHVPRELLGPRGEARGISLQPRRPRPRGLPASRVHLAGDVLPRPLGPLRDDVLRGRAVGVGPVLGHPVSPRGGRAVRPRSEEHTSELQSPDHLVCRLLLEKKKNKKLVCLLLNAEVLRLKLVPNPN